LEGRAGFRTYKQGCQLAWQRSSQNVRERDVAQGSTTATLPAGSRIDVSRFEFDRHRDLHAGYEATGQEICQQRLTNCDTRQILPLSLDTFSTYMQHRSNSSDYSDVSGELSNDLSTSNPRLLLSPCLPHRQLSDFADLHKASQVSA
jgi:hypothetical protein